MYVVNDKDNRILKNSKYRSKEFVLYSETKIIRSARTKGDYYALEKTHGRWVLDDPKIGIGVRHVHGIFYASKTFYDARKGRRMFSVRCGDGLENPIVKRLISIMGDLQPSLLKQR